MGHTVYLLGYYSWSCVLWNNVNEKTLAMKFDKTASNILAYNIIYF